MNINIKTLIEVNKFASKNIKELQDTIANATFDNSEKDRINFGNLCTALTGFRLVNDAMEALLTNEDIVVTEQGGYYQKIDDNNEPEFDKEEKKDE